MNVEFTKEQRQYILNCVESAKSFAKRFQNEHNGSYSEYRFYLLGALESILADLCDKSSSALFNNED